MLRWPTGLLRVFSLTPKQEVAWKAWFGPSGEVEQAILLGTTGAAVGAAGHAKVVYDTPTDRLRVSYNGAGYVDVGLSGLPASGMVGDLIVADSATTWARLASVAAASYLRSNGIGAPPLWSTLTLPNAATHGDLFAASGANAMGVVAAAADGNVLRSAGVATLPVYGKVRLSGAPTDVTGTLPVGSGGTGTATAFTQGSVVFAGASGVYAQNNGEFAWDDSARALLLFGGTLGTNASRVLALGSASGADPTTFPADTVQIRAKDLDGGAGTTGLVLWDERGSRFDIGDVVGGMSAGHRIVSAEGVTLTFGTETGRGFVGTISNHPLDVFANNTQWGRITGVGNWILGTDVAVGANAAGVLYLNSGTAPTTSPADKVALWAVDAAGAGTTALFIRDEESTITRIGHGTLGTTSNHALALMTNAISRVHLDTAGNAILGTEATVGTNAAGVFYLDLGTAPTTSPADKVALYAEDVAGAGTTGVRVRDETGVVYTIGQGIRSAGPSAGIGYATGAGGSVTQITSKATGVTLDKVVGQVVMNGAALGAGAEVTFALSNNTVAATDLVVVNHVTGGTAGAYLVGVAAVGSGTVSIVVANVSGGSLSEAITLGFAVIKGVTA